MLAAVEGSEPNHIVVLCCYLVITPHLVTHLSSSVGRLNVLVAWKGQDPLLSTYMEKSMSWVSPVLVRCCLNFSFKSLPTPMSFNIL